MVHEIPTIVAYPDLVVCSSVVGKREWKVDDDGLVVPDLEFRPFTAVFGSAFRFLFDAADWDNTHFVINLGISGNRFSRRYKNHFSNWINNRYSRFPYSRDAIRNRALGSYLLAPPQGSERL